MELQALGGDADLHQVVDREVAERVGLSRAGPREEDGAGGGQGDDEGAAAGPHPRWASARSARGA